MNLKKLQYFFSDDEASTSFLSILDDDDVKVRLNLNSTFPVVAIKLESGSAPCAQVGYFGTLLMQVFRGFWTQSFCL